MSEYVDTFSFGMVASAILQHGQSDVVDRYVTAMCRGDLIGCQLFGEEGSGCDVAGRTNRHLRMLTALAITSTTVISDTADWRSIAILAQRLRGSVSVGENAVAFVNDK